MSFGFNFKATVWQLTLTGGDGPFDPPTENWARSVIDCEWQTGNETKKDENNAEFLPRTVFFTLVAVPKNSKILPGDIPDLTPPANAETVRAVDGGTGFPGEPIEFVVSTA